MADIINRDNPILREKAEKVPIVSISTPHIQTIIADMKEALAREDDGVAIAAPQIGQSLRIFVVSGKVLSQNTPEKISDDLVFINPEILKLSKEKKMMAEGCLSVRYLYGNVERSTKATLRAYDEKGQLFERGGSGLLAQIFQHETDHLDGILFIDKAVDLEDLPPEKLKAAQTADHA
jgi:peptide deformylase